ncbi:hypothetical protein ECC02_002288 [Trypanosoma cruzi]|uniref:Uncharacterized protein n=1 Tax=Trypanosoma cruzi TaxID=5693 RepID=A0A7J6YEZ3_TRYCR|nr:hypothetical protein ECC02_002288 [Trypanosoma cruzi]
MDGSIGRKLTPPQFIRAGVFMCRHIHREGNGGPFLFRCTAGSTVATCVHRIGHMAHSTQLTISAVHAHIKATKSIILILSLSTGSRTLLPRPHTHTHAIARAAVTRSTRHIHRHNHRIRITRYMSRTPSTHHAHGRAAAARERKDQHGAHTTRCRTVTIVIIAVIITRSGVAAVSELIREPEETEWNRRERDGVQRIQRERADNMRRGQQAQPHSSHTTRRHPRNEGTQRQQPPTMQEEKTSTTISPSSSLQPQGNGKSPRPPHNAHGTSTHHTSHTRKRTLIHP